MDIFKQNNIRECTRYDHLDTNIYKSHDHTKEGLMLKRIARRRLKHQLRKEVKQWI